MKQISRLYFYGNIHIALAAVFFAIEPFVIRDLALDPNYLVFVFGSTLAMYNLHRLIGLSKIRSQMKEERFGIIKKDKQSIIILGVIGSLLSIYTLQFIDWAVIKLLFLPILFSMAYVLPLFPSKKRFRDYNGIKIFLIAGVWAFICCPIFLNIGLSTPWIVLILIERFLFILAITIPFDIRDQSVDRISELGTLVTFLNEKKAVQLSLLLLFLSFCCLILCYVIYPFPFHFLVIYGIIFLISFFSLMKVRQAKPDLYFTGWLDGLILLRGLLIWLSPMVI